MHMKSADAALNDDLYQMVPYFSKYCDLLIVMVLISAINILTFLHFTLGPIIDKPKKTFFLK